MGEGIFTTTVQLGDLYGENRPDFEVVLREHTLKEQIGLQRAGEDMASQIEYIAAILPSCVVRAKWQNKDMEPAKAAEKVLSSAVATGQLVKEWMESLPLEKRRPGKSGK